MSYPDQPGSPGGTGRRLTNRNTNRYSVTALFSMAAEQDVEVEDELARGAPSLAVFPWIQLMIPNYISPEAPSGSQGQDLCTVEEEFRAGT